MSKKKTRRSVIFARAPVSRGGYSGNTAARLAWAFAGAPAGFTPDQTRALARASRFALLVERPRVRAARLAFVQAYASALRAGLSNDVATRNAGDVYLERAGWMPKSRK